MLPVGCKLTHGVEDELAQVHTRVGDGEPRMVEYQLVYGYYVNVDVAVDVVAGCVTMW